MKVVILAGGVGTRITEETVARPKPMIEIGGRPIIWHIMKIYSHFGLNDFIVCLGYRGYMIKEFFSNYFLHMSDITFNTRTNKMEVHRRNAEDWRVTLVDTGTDTLTGGRIKRIKSFVEDDDAFALTYGDGVADVDIAGLIACHDAHDGLATVTAVKPAMRFGALELSDGRVTAFHEKADEGASWINGGFFIVSPKVCDMIGDDQTAWEREPLERLARDGELYGYNHDGFWHPMDTMRDRLYLEEQWQSGNAPWKVWD